MERDDRPPPTAAFLARELYRIRDGLLEDELCRPDAVECGRRCADAALATIRRLRAELREARR